VHQPIGTKACHQAIIMLSLISNVSAVVTVE